MKVEVDTQAIAALEQQADQVGQLLSMIVARSKNKTVELSPSQQNVAGSVQIDTKDDGTIRLKFTPEA